MLTKVSIIVSLIAMLVLFEKVNKRKTTLYTVLNLLLISIMVQACGILLQLIFGQKLNIDLVYYEYISYIGGMFIPSLFLLLALVYSNHKINIKKASKIIYPAIFLLIALWTNDFHHMFFVKYSTNIKEGVTGLFFKIYTVYAYVQLILAMFIMLKTSLKKSGFLSSQTWLIILGCLFPLVPNALATFGLISLTVYVTPIMFTGTAICFYISIIRLKALNVIPVTLKAIVDNMSDAFVVISEDGTIADLNKTFVEKFKVFKVIKNKDNLFEIMDDTGLADVKQVEQDIAEAWEKGITITKEYHVQKETYDRYFEVDFQPVKSKDDTQNVATLVLLRDITTAKKDMEMMLKNESLVMLGELAGGVAHDINTPISAIKSGLLIFRSIAKTDDEKMLVERMDSCANKIVTLTNSLRNQIRNIGSNEVSEVNITTIVKDLAIILHNELTKNKVELNLNVRKDIIVSGNSSKLSQVVTNIVVNAIQAYEGKSGKVNLQVYEENNQAIISVQDFAGGIPEKIRESIGKNILTTKGVSGTGFGLYLAYSVIKGSFGGEITFETEVGKGTTFYISIPIQQDIGGNK